MKTVIILFEINRKQFFVALEPKILRENIFPGFPLIDHLHEMVSHNSNNKGSQIFFFN